MLKKYSEEERMFRHYKNCKYIGYVNEMPEIYFDLKFDDIHKFIDDVGCFGNLSISVKSDGEVLLTTKNKEIYTVLLELLNFKRNDEHAIACLQEIKKELNSQKVEVESVAYAQTEDVHDFIKRLNELRISYGMDEIHGQEYMDHPQLAY